MMLPNVDALPPAQASLFMHDVITLLDTHLTSIIIARTRVFHTYGA
jgi:hypothetical protein